MARSSPPIPEQMESTLKEDEATSIGPRLPAAHNLERVRLDWLVEPVERRSPEHVTDQEPHGSGSEPREQRFNCFHGAGHRFLVALGFEVVAQQAHQRRLVLDHKDARLHDGGFSAPPRRVTTSKAVLSPFGRERFSGSPRSLK